MMRTNDPIKDFNRWDLEQWEKEQRLPICALCGGRIYEDYAYTINKQRYCEKCIEDSKEYFEEEDIYGY